MKHFFRLIFGVFLVFGFRTDTRAQVPNYLELSELGGANPRAIATGKRYDVIDASSDLQITFNLPAMTASGTRVKVTAIIKRNDSVSLNIPNGVLCTKDIFPSTDPRDAVPRAAWVMSGADVPNRVVTITL